MQRLLVFFMLFLVGSSLVFAQEKKPEKIVRYTTEWDGESLTVTVGMALGFAVPFEANAETNIKDAPVIISDLMDIDGVISISISSESVVITKAKLALFEEIQPQVISCLEKYYGRKFVLVAAPPSPVTKAKKKT